MIDLRSILEKAVSAVESASSAELLEQVQVNFLGKKGELSQALRELGSLSAEDRPRVGALANDVRAQIERVLGAKRQLFAEAELRLRLERERIDVSLTTHEERLGHLHPVTQTLRRLVDIGSRLGFEVRSGPEVELDYFNFEAVNIPQDHPARDMQDTFFIEPGVVLRTHTTPVQIRSMQSGPWPVRILCPGAVYRCDDDATHSPMFHQMEGLWVDKGVNLSDLKGILEYFTRELFGSETKIRLRPSYFSFVEPGVEVDVSCFRCRTKIDPSCRICKNTGWLEIMGAGMVHPKLFESAGYQPDPELSGFAFGMGIERIAMLLYEIPDLRLMFQNDFRFLTQF